MPDVVLPVLDEAAAIPGVLASIPADWNVIVVDNGSTDGSSAVARRRRRARRLRAPAWVRRRLLCRPLRRRVRRRGVHGLRRFVRRARSPACRAPGRRRSPGSRARRSGGRARGLALAPADREIASSPTRSAVAPVCPSPISAPCARRDAPSSWACTSATDASAGRSRWSYGPARRGGGSTRSTSPTAAGSGARR